MEVVNEILPTDPERIARMSEPGPEGPIYMVNLLEFRERAEYPDGRETDLTGRQAYELYARAVARILPDYGGEIVFVGDVTFCPIGVVEKLWDEIAIVRYPSRRHLWEMSTSAAWQEASVHRTAGLAGQLNIETVAP